MSKVNFPLYYPIRTRLIFSLSFPPFLCLPFPSPLLFPYLLLHSLPLYLPQSNQGVRARDDFLPQDFFFYISLLL